LRTAQTHDDEAFVTTDNCRKVTLQPSTTCTTTETTTVNRCQAPIFPWKQSIASNYRASTSMHEKEQSHQFCPKQQSDEKQEGDCPVCSSCKVCDTQNTSKEKALQSR